MMRSNSYLALPATIILLVFGNSSVAGQACPANYDECVAMTVMGNTGDYAVENIRRSCRARFPEGVTKSEQMRLTDTELSNLVGVAGLVAKGDGFRGEIFNGNRCLTLKEVTISVTAREGDTEKVIKETIQVSIGPVTSGRFSFGAKEWRHDAKVQLVWKVEDAAGTRE